MVNSETRIKNIKLGQKLIKELISGSDIDSFSRWMVHYIAEQIRIANSAKGKKKIEAERKCFETILKLWKHRAYLPSGHRPFENFETIFRILERIDPKNKNQYYYEQSVDDKSKRKIPNDVKKMLDTALVIDEVARVWLSLVFKCAAQHAIDKETIEWLKTVSGLAKEDDISVIIRLSGEESLSEENKTNQIKKEKEEEIKSRIKQLDSFVVFSKILKKEFLNELKNLKLSNS